MKLVLTLVLLLHTAAPPLAAADGRDLVLSGIPLRLEGVSDAMEAPAVQVLQKQLSLAGDRTVSPPLADDLAFFLQQSYLQSGYDQAKVGWKVSGPRAVLLVREGQRRTVGTVTITGVGPAEAGALLPYLTRQTKERGGRLAKKLPFVQADLEAGLGLMVRKLQADGYLQATAAPLEFRPDPATPEVAITAALTPRRLSVFGEVRIEGDVSHVSREALEKVRALTGQPWSEVRLETVRQAVKGDLQAQGWFAAEVTVGNPAPESGAPAPALPESVAAPSLAGTLPALLVVQPGRPYRVTEVRAGPDSAKPGAAPAPALSKGARRVVNAVFDPANGEPYHPETLELLHRRALDTGIFSRLEVDPLVLGPDTMALLVSGEEAKPKTLGLFAGYETFFGPIAGVEARHVNFMDSGNSLGLRAELRGTGANGNLQWTDPAIFGSRQSLGISLGLETFTFKDYSRTSFSLRSSLTRRINRRITAELFSAASVNATESPLLTPEELGPDSYATLTAGGRLVLDFRDNPLNPRSGWMAGAAFEGGYDQGGEEDVGYARTDLNAAWYQPLGGPWRIALAARSATIHTNGSTSATGGGLPIDLRLFNGGGTTVRSFAEREMGRSSAEGETPLGGTAMAVFNAELSYQIATSLEIAAFADAGSLTPDGGSLFSADDLRYGLGLGVRYQLPIGPLRVDYGVNPSRRRGEAAGALHLTFGFAF